MTDQELSEWLRNYANRDGDKSLLHAMMYRAADAIARLTRERDEARAALTNAICTFLERVREDGGILSQMDDAFAADSDIPKYQQHTFSHVREAIDVLLIVAKERRPIWPALTAAKGGGE